MAPSSVSPGTTLTVLLTGFNFVSGATSVNITGAGVTVDPSTIIVSSSTQLTATFAVSPAAATGTRSVTVSTSAAEATRSSINA
jgi:hypothetical protein